MRVNFGQNGMGFHSIGSGNDHTVTRDPVKMMILQLNLIPISAAEYGDSFLEELPVS